MTRVLVRGESADLYDADTGEHVGAYGAARLRAV